MHLIMYRRVEVNNISYNPTMWRLYDPTRLRKSNEGKLNQQQQILSRVKIVQFSIAYNQTQKSRRKQAAALQHYSC